MKDCRNGAYNKINASNNNKDELEAILDKLEITQDHQAKLKEHEREKYQME